MTSSRTATARSSQLRDTKAVRAFTFVVSFLFGWGLLALIGVITDAAFGLTIPAAVTPLGGVALDVAYAVSLRGRRTVALADAAQSAAPAPAADVAAETVELNRVQRKAVDVANDILQPVPAGVKALLKNKAAFTKLPELEIEAIMTVNRKVGYIASAEVGEGDIADVTAVKMFNMIVDKMQETAGTDIQMKAILVATDKFGPYLREVGNVVITSKTNITKAVERLNRVA